MYFLNTGQGHGFLALYETGVPLLIDGGSTISPYIPNHKFEWEKSNVNTVVRAAGYIIRHWSRTKEYRINIIVTHEDQDHFNLIVDILKELRSYLAQIFPIQINLLLGGSKNQYELFRKELSIVSSVRTVAYSEDYIGLYLYGNLWFLEDSKCVHYIYCPKGNKSNKNSWSIVVCLSMYNILALLTGDCDETIKGEMCSDLSLNNIPLASDILLLPHHGSFTDTNHCVWDSLADPKVIIVGAGTNDKYCHPRGETLLYFLEKCGQKIWEGTTKEHVLFYNCNEEYQVRLDNLFEEKERLYEVIPYYKEDIHNDTRWYLVWVDIAIYTLWSTGSLLFEDDICNPLYLDTPTGLLQHFAIPSMYHICPSIRENTIEYNIEYTRKLEIEIRDRVISKVWDIDRITEQFIDNLDNLGITYEQFLDEDIYSYIKKWLDYSIDTDEFVLNEDYTTEMVVSRVKSLIDLNKTWSSSEDSIETSSFSSYSNTSSTSEYF